MSTNLENRVRTTEKKREYAAGQRNETRKRGKISRARDNKGDIFLLEEQHDNFVAAVRKYEMLVATNAR